MCSACLDRRGKDDAVLLDAGGEPVAADDEALGAVAEAHGAQPDELLLAGQLVAHPRLAAIRAGQHHARVPGHDAVAARHLHAVEAGVLQRLEEPELLDRAGLDRAALYLPGAAAVARAQHEPVDADHPALRGRREADAEERLLGTDGSLRPRPAAVVSREQGAVLARHEAVLRVRERDVVEDDVVGERAVLPVLAAVVRDGHRAPVADRPRGPRVERPHLEERLLRPDRARLARPRRPGVLRVEDERRLADHPAVSTPRQAAAEARRLRGAVARLPRLAGVRRVVDRPEVADGPRLASVDRLDVVEVVAEDRAGRGASGHRAREREAGRPRRPCAARSPRGRHRSRHYTGVLTASIQADGARLRPVASDHAVALEGAEVVRRKPEQLAVDVRVVLAEPRRTVADRAGRARETRI